MPELAQAVHVPLQPGQWSHAWPVDPAGRDKNSAESCASVFLTGTQDERTLSCQCIWNARSCRVANTPGHGANRAHHHKAQTTATSPPGAPQRWSSTDTTALNPSPPSLVHGEKPTTRYGAAEGLEERKSGSEIYGGNLAETLRRPGMGCSHCILSKAPNALLTF